MRTKRILFLLTLCIAAICHSQSKPAGPVMATPNATSLGLYGEVPVSYFTGLPTIEVPLYTIQERGLNFPLTLSYHAQGFRPDVHPSWVGANWSLNFGGVITRKMNNLPDEWSTDDYGIYGYYYSHHRLNNPNWSATDTLMAMGTATGYYQRKLDREPDEFVFNFQGFSGKFFLDHLGKWRVQSSKNLRVLFDEADLINPFFHNTVPVSSIHLFKPKVFGKFTLVDDAGIKYVFGKTNYTDAIEYSSGITPPDYNYRLWMIATSWYLAEIQFPDGTGHININYERGPFQSSFQYFESQNRFFVYRCAPGINGTSNFDAKGLSGTISSPVYAKDISTTSGVRVEFRSSKSNELAYPTSTYFEVFRDELGRLPSQQTPHGVIPSNYFNFMQAWSEVPYYVQNGIWADGIISNNKFAWFKLDSVVVSNYDLNNNMAKTAFRRVVFNYRENPYERLKLLSLNYKGSEPGNESQNYSLKYNDWGAAAPAYVSDLTDHWGFANNKPLKRDPYFGGYAWFGGSMLTNRAPDETATKMDILTSITYPTGGSSSFEYELNSYGKYLLHYTRSYAPPGEGTAGGLRIKKIINDDGLGNTDTREFFYVNGYDPSLPAGSRPCSGILDGKPGYSNYNYSITVNGRYLSLYSSNSIVPLSANSGAICGYSEVAERMKNGSYKIYKFTNHDNGFIDDNAINNVTPYELGVPYRSRSFERGQLLSEELFSAAKLPVQKTEYTYVRIGAGADSNFIRSLRKDFGGYCTTLLPPTVSPYIGQVAMGFQVPMMHGFYVAPESFNPEYTTATAYGYYVYKFLPATKTQKNYPSAGQTNTMLVTSSANEYDAVGNLIKTIQTDSKGLAVTNHLKYPYHFSGTAVYDAMMGRHMNGVVVASESYRGEKLLGKERTDYDLFNNGALIKPKYLAKQVGTNTPFITMQFNRYDDKGNILELEGADGIKTAYVWSYFKTRPVAKVTGADYGAVLPILNQQVLSYPSGGEDQLLAEADKLRTQLPAAYVSTYLYDAASDWGMKQAKDHNGNSAYYKYDKMGRLVQVRDKDSNIIKQTDYKYGAQAAYTYLNVERSAVFQNTTCSPGYAGTLNYIVPAGKYGSFISQGAADYLAQNDIFTNGQTAANTQAPCLPYYNYTACCGWSSFSSSFTLTGTGAVNFSLVVLKNTSGSSNNNVTIGTLSGPLFLPAGIRNVNFSSPGVSGMISIFPNGTVRLSTGPAPAMVQVSGSYSL